MLLLIEMLTQQKCNYYGKLKIKVLCVYVFLRLIMRWFITGYISIKKLDFVNMRGGAYSYCNLTCHVWLLFTGGLSFLNRNGGGVGGESGQRGGGRRDWEERREQETAVRMQIEIIILNISHCKNRTWLWMNQKM